MQIVIEKRNFMKLKFIAPPEPLVKYTANVHSTGRIGFSIKAAKAFKIDTTKSMKLAINEEDKSDDNIYGVLLDKVDEANAYIIKKNAGYHSIYAKGFFEEANIKYGAGDISYSITEEEIDGTKILKFNKINKIKK